VWRTNAPVDGLVSQGPREAVREPQWFVALGGLGMIPALFIAADVGGEAVLFMAGAGVVVLAIHMLTLRRPVAWVDAFGIEIRPYRRLLDEASHIPWSTVTGVESTWRGVRIRTGGGSELIRLRYMPLVSSRFVSEQIRRAWQTYGHPPPPPVR
jgi:hypothetical protein